MIFRKIFINIQFIIIMIEQSIGRGWNIKCYDKIKLTSVITSCRLHSNSFGYKSGSYNTAVTCHKVRDQTDWFVVLRPSESSMSYHFRYGDEIVLKNVQTKKMLHLDEDFESPASKNIQVSLCEQEDGKEPCYEDQWIVQIAQGNQDQYWRGGEIVRIKNKNTSAYLCTHKKKIKQNDDYEVFGLKIKPQLLVHSNKNKQQGSSQQKSSKFQQTLWIVSQITPFIFTPAISEQKKIKITEEVEQLNKLKATLSHLPKKAIKHINSTEEILKMENRRLEQIESQKRKYEDYKQKLSCWKKYFCCCCIEGPEGYSKLQ